MTSLLDLPLPRLHLRPWGDDVRAAWDTRAEHASALTARAGVGRNFALLVAEARELLLAGDTSGVIVRARDRRFFRAVLTAWLDDADLTRATMSASLLASLSAWERCSRLTT